VGVASITIRRLDEAVKAKLKARAASHGRSMEEEAREILRSCLRARSVPRLNLAESIRRYVEPFGGVELVLRPRQAVRRPPGLAK
jgi:plasmid stability protein